MNMSHVREIVHIFIGREKCQSYLMISGAPFTMYGNFLLSI